MLLLSGTIASIKIDAAAQQQRCRRHNQRQRQHHPHHRHRRRRRRIQSSGFGVLGEGVSVGVGQSLGVGFSRCCPLLAAQPVDDSNNDDGIAIPATSTFTGAAALTQRQPIEQQGRRRHYESQSLVGNATLCAATVSENANFYNTRK